MRQRTTEGFEPLDGPFAPSDGTLGPSSPHRHAVEGASKGPSGRPTVPKVPSNGVYELGVAYGLGGAASYCSTLPTSSHSHLTNH